MIEERTYQTSIVSKTIEHFTNGNNSVIIESPTGSGKTIMGLTVAKALQGNKKLFKNKPTVGWVAMRSNLLVQAEVSNKMIGVENISYISMFDKDPVKCDILILDEARHSACSSGNTIVDACSPKFILGLDATPQRPDKLQLAFGKKVNDASTNELIRMGYLTNVVSYTIDEYTPSNVVKHFLLEKEKWGKTLMFFINNTEATECNEMLRANGVKSELVTANTDRELQIEKLKNGELDVLVNMFVLTEGFDYNELNTIFVRDSSEVPTKQMVGRGLRTATDKKHANIVQSKNTHYHVAKYIDLKAKYKWVEKEWIPIMLTENANLLRNEMISRIIKGNVVLPSMLRVGKKRKSSIVERGDSESD
jgi:superfamily II DNA or RNA helicase